MKLEGNVAILTRLQQAVSAVKKQFMQMNPLVMDVTLISISEGSDVVKTVASSSDAKKTAFDAGVLQLHVANVQEEAKTSILMKLTICGLVDTVSKDISSPFYAELSDTTCFNSKKQSLERPPVDYEKNYDDDSIDEDTLLNDTNTVLQAAKANCGVVGGKKRACNNCTCGRTSHSRAKKELKRLVSGCGNVRLFEPWWVVISTLLLFIVCVSLCYEGDAFRFSSCLFLGKPSFKSGMEKVLLNLNNSG
ncbi:hypothetical protein PsorP6_001525 [Peronosclerospora sorghi]|uniref:Uncharacterized protein n=1 Tax=Peronosclerospora sorghi TaxID=230839 RepID=A0ACC0WSQ8_9STRA|nr:hypothetical protein PsorP6_001525 [Peronosclerospora sorghi]